MSMGPRGGLAEIRLPALQEGSSIMPDKVNPVITEMATGVAFQVMSLDHAITLSAASGQFELNAFLPLIAFNLLTELKLLANAVSIFRTHLVEGIERMRSAAGGGLRRVSALPPRLRRTSATKGPVSSQRRPGKKERRSVRPPSRGGCSRKRRSKPFSRRAS